MQQITNSGQNEGGDDRGLLNALLGDGRPLLLLSGLALVLAGAFALFLSASKHFLPHDVDYLGMTAEQLCGINNCRVVYFMFHDRVAFGGALIAIGVLYLWLAEFPLRRGEAWAWWAFVVSGIFGFGSFLAYLGYGYLDTWHGAATLLILPCFVIGLAKSRGHLRTPRGIRWLFKPGARVNWLSAFGIGRALLLAVAGGMIAGLGGASLTLFYPGSWNEGISSGQGLIAVALVIFARWSPLRCVGAALLFGGAGAIGPALQSVGVGWGYHLFNTVPYVLTLVILVFTCKPGAVAAGTPGELSSTR